MCPGRILFGESMDRLKMQTPDLVDENIEKIGKLFPECLTQRIGADGKTYEPAIDLDKLSQLFSKKMVQGADERYQFTWPGKKQAIITANAPINKTLRPCREKSVDFDNTENLYIEGDNLDALKLLREDYLGKVKMIYIDPPYNTGNDIVYEDDFAQTTNDYIEKSGQTDQEGNRLVVNMESNGRFHSDWLNMIYPRLKIAKDFLSDDGVIFISIDDNEVDNLRKVCDEIFGNINFIAHLIHKNNSMKNQSKYVGVSSEFILIYAKDIISLGKKQPIWRANKKGAEEVNAIFHRLKAEGRSLEYIRDAITDMYSRPKYSHLSRWNKVDEYGVFMDSDLSRANGPKNYTIINPNTGKPCIIPSRGWGKSEEELKRLQAEHLIWYGDGSKPPRMKSYITSDTESVFDNFVFADTSIDKKLLHSLFGCEVFEYPKSLELMKALISLCTKDDTVLDFFSGSATTAHAVMQLNAEDGRARKFILIQIPEKVPDGHAARKAGYKNICEIGEERIRRAGKKILEGCEKEHPNFSENKKISKPDIGFRVLKVDSSNMKDVYYKPSDITHDLFAQTEENIKEDRTDEDLLFQVMLEMSVPLSAKIRSEEIFGRKVLIVDDDYLIACFDKNITDEVITDIAKRKPQYFVMRDSSAMDDSVITNFETIFQTYSKDTVRKIL